MHAAWRFLTLGLAAAATLALLVLPFLLPAWQWELTATRKHSVMANMHAIQMGLEQYAGDHAGHYPARLAQPDFDWRQYVPHTPLNPYDAPQQGERLIEATIAVDPPVAARAAASPPFKFPGALRYYVSRDQQTYALTGAGRDLLPVDEVRGYRRYVYVVHNEQDGPPARPLGWAPADFWRYMLLSGAHAGVIPGILIGLLLGSRSAAAGGLALGIGAATLGALLGLFNGYVIGGWDLDFVWKAGRGDLVVASGLLAGGLAGANLGRAARWAGTGFLAAWVVATLLAVIR